MVPLGNRNSSLKHRLGVPDDCQRGWNAFKTSFCDRIAARRRRLRIALWKFLFSVLERRIPTCRTRLTLEQKQEIISSLQPGDIPLESNANYPLWQIAVMIGTGSSWSHCAFYAGGGGVIDAGTKPQVAVIDIDSFLSTHYVALLRPRY